MSRWKTIDTCPDGVYVLLTGYWDGDVKNKRWAAVGWREEDFFYELAVDAVREELHQPTHWKSLGRKTADGGKLDKDFMDPEETID